jgi:hypothetical protein
MGERRFVRPTIPKVKNEKNNGLVYVTPAARGMRRKE